MRSVPGVWDCAVVGVTDDRFGETPVTFIVAERRLLDAPAVLAAVTRHCEQHLGRGTTEALVLAKRVVDYNLKVRVKSDAAARTGCGLRAAGFRRADRFDWPASTILAEPYSYWRGTIVSLAHEFAA